MVFYAVRYDPWPTTDANFFLKVPLYLLEVEFSAEIVTKNRLTLDYIA